jgi:hypothetical protein
MEKFSQPMATVVSTIILVLGLLVAFKTGGSEPQKNYAFVNFDGGFEAIGVLQSERVYTEVEITFNGDRQYSGTVSEVISEIKADTENPSTTSWKKGLVVDASGGIKWTGSASTGFLLTTESYYVSSDGNLNIQNVINSLQKMENDIKAGRETTREASLEFTFPPAGADSALLRSALSGLFN